LAGRSWRVICPQAQHVVDTGIHAACVELDPRAHTVRLGVGTPNACSHEQAAGAIVQLFLAGEKADWTQTLRWLNRPEARKLLQVIDTGFTAELLWSGDWSADWSPAARAALLEIHDRISMLTG
jgi:hypothetical protein